MSFSPRSRFAIVALTAGVMMLVWAFNVLYVEATIAPVVCLTFLFIVALRYPPLVVTFVWLVLWAFVAYSLASIPSFSFDRSEDLVRLAIRLLSFGVGGAMAILTSRFRCRLVEFLDHMLAVLSKVPLPILVSDSTGRIRVVSEQATVLLNRESSELLNSYFQALVGSHLAEEISENWYEHWVGGEEEMVFDVQLLISGVGSTPARVCRMGSGENALLITVFGHGTPPPHKEAVKSAS